MASSRKKTAPKNVPATKKAAPKRVPPTQEKLEAHKKNLSAAQEMFCQLFAGSREYYNNGTQAYLIAYDYPVIDLPEVTHPAPAMEEYSDENISDAETMRVGYRYPEWYLEEKRAYELAKKAIERQENVAAVLAGRLLRKVKIRDRCREILAARLTDADVDLELANIIHGAKPEVAIRGIAEYNKLKGRIIEHRRFSGTIVTTEMTDKEREELDKILGINS